MRHKLRWPTRSRRLVRSAGEREEICGCSKNTERRRLVELLMVPVQIIRIEARSKDWQNDSEERSRVSEVLARRPPR
jgi:hypothetical protein